MGTDTWGGASQAESWLQVNPPRPFEELLVAAGYRSWLQQQHMYQHDTIKQHSWRKWESQTSAAPCWSHHILNQPGTGMKSPLRHSAGLIVALESKLALSETLCSLFWSPSPLTYDWAKGAGPGGQGMNTMIENSGRLAGGCAAEKCSVIIMCTLQHSVSFVVTSHYRL